jgi:hypothetical protein
MYSYAGSSWELVLYQRYPASTSGGVTNPTEVNIEISESVVKSILSSDAQQENVFEIDIDREGVNIEDKVSNEQIRNVLFHTEDQFGENLNPYSVPEYDEIGDGHYAINYEAFGPNTIVEFS